MTPTRYTIERHPEATDRTPNAWKCTGYDAKDRIVVVRVGSSATEALANAVRPDMVVYRTPKRSWWRRLID